MSSERPLPASGGDSAPASEPPAPRAEPPRPDPVETRSLPPAGEAARRSVRPRLTLRIPDDAVGAPQPSPAPPVVRDSRAPRGAAPYFPTPAPYLPAPTEPAAASQAPAPADNPTAIKANRIITIGPPSSDEAARTVSLPRPSANPSLGRPVLAEDSWTPYQPTVAEVPLSERDDARAPSSTSLPDDPRLHEIPVDDGDPGYGIPITTEGLDDLSPAPLPAIGSEGDSEPPRAVREPPAEARLRARVDRPIDGFDPFADLPPMRNLAPTEPDSEEVRFEDPEPPRPLIEPRRSEPPEAEILAEDLVSVDSQPVPGRLNTLDVLLPPAAAAGTSKSQAPAAGSIAPAETGSIRAPRVIVPLAVTSPLAPPPLSEGAPTGRRRIRPWWEELFNDDYIRTMARISDAQIATEATFIEESLAVAQGAMVLDLACGTGRHAIELTRRGYKVVGFDLSLPMLARAADEAQERSQRLNFVQGDMREMTFEDTFDGIYSWNTSFGFFEEEKNFAVVTRVHKALRKGGQFLLDVVNRDYLVAQAPSVSWFEGEGCVCMDEMSLDWITSRMRVKRTMMMDDGRTREIEYSVRVYSLHELGKVLHDAGFRVAEVSGRVATPGVFFGGESPRTLILAEKR